MTLSTVQPRPVLPTLLALALTLAACSGGPNTTEVQRPPLPEPTPTPTVPPTPTPTAHPVPVVADVVGVDAPVRAEFVVSIDVGSTNEGASGQLSFRGSYDTEMDAIEVAFELEQFIAAGPLANAVLGIDPLVGDSVTQLGGTWVLRRVGTAVYVQHPVLADRAGEATGDWLEVVDPVIVESLISGGLLGGGFTQQAMHDLARSGGGQAMPYNDGGSLDAYDFRVDGAEVRIGQRGAAASAAFLGIPRLHEFSSRVFAAVGDQRLLNQMTVYVPAGGFGAESEFTAIDIHYLPPGEDVEFDLSVPTNVVGG